ncbi:MULTISPECIES: hypothetical protein [unclassified Microcystis]|uniref:hypothetical protein n=1 Tax=unclassified Microcystis TaxID=2643300 RepID=UPI0022C0CF66|nr:MULTISPECIES: hypothetical protein [unclassified Microcystis]MCZ8050241.1 hypothetical protein [Microcystis sp. LE19-41.2A]MCZ8291530.1 hypothetical protein [Microcystis sp. LE19-59.1C]
MRNPARERSRNLNREVWESPSVLRRRGCQADRFDTITLQPGNIAYARLTAASPQYVIDKLGEYSVSGHLIARIVNVQ